MMPSALSGSWKVLASATGVANIKTRLPKEGLQQLLLFKGQRTVYVVVVSAEGRTLLSCSPSSSNRPETNREISASDFEALVAAGGTNILRVNGASFQEALAKLHGDSTSKFEYTDQFELKVGGYVVQLEVPAAADAGSLTAEAPEAR